MRQEEFNRIAHVVAKEYRAVCYTQGRHWLGPWRPSYTEAYNDGDAHRNGFNGGGPFHDIRIIESVSLEARI